MGVNFNIGDVLEVSDGTWYGNNTFTYQWLRDGVSIANATTSQYIIVVADNETLLSAVVTATNANGSVSVASGNYAPVTGSILMDPPDSLDLISDTIQVGHFIFMDLASLTLTASQPFINEGIGTDATPEVLVLTALTVTVEENVNVDIASLALTAQQPFINEGIGADATPEVLVLTAPTTEVGIFIDVDTASLTLLAFEVTVPVTLATLTLTASTVEVAIFINMDTASLTLTAPVVTIVEG